MGYETASEKRKHMIADSFKKFMRHKPFPKITVSEIINDCGINRKTFYYHFEDMYALLKWTLEQEAIEIVKQYDLIVEYEEAIRFVMDYVEKNDAILNNICSYVGRDELHRFFYADFTDISRSIIENVEKAKNIALPDSYKIFLERFYTGALAGILLEWIKDSSVRNKEETLRYISVILHSTIPRAMDENTLLQLQDE